MIKEFLNALLGESIKCVTTSCEVLNEDDLGIKTIFDGTIINNHSMLHTLFESEHDE